MLKKERNKTIVFYFNIFRCLYYCIIFSNDKNYKRYFKEKTLRNIVLVKWFVLFETVKLDIQKVSGTIIGA